MPLTRDEITRLVELEADLQGVDPRLAVAVATQESGLRPDNPGDNGRSRGVFHLQERAAIDAGIDPKQRDDTAIGIFGGVNYLKKQLDRSKGHIPTALSYYNRGTPDYRGIGDPDYVYHVMRHYPDHPLGKAPEDQEAYRARLNKTFGKGTAPAPQQQPGILARVGTALSPASAEASGLSPAERQRLDELEASLVEPQQPPQATTPSPPTARSTPEQDAAYRASRGQQEPASASQAAPAPQGQPGARQGPSGVSLSLGDPRETATEAEAAATIAQIRQRQSPAQERFLALPSIASLSEEERQGALREFQAMQTTQQEEVIKMEQPGYWQKQVNQPGMTVPGPSAEENLTAPSTMIPLLMPGAGLKFVAKPAADVVLKQGVPWATRGASALAEGLSQTAGWTAGRAIETGDVPSPGEIGTEAAFNVAAGGLLEGLGGTGQAILRRSQAGKAIVAADEATTAARQTWEQEVTTAKAELQAGRTEAYQAAERRAKAAQAQYQHKVQERDATIAANQAEYQQAVSAQQQEYQQALAAHRTKVQGEQAARYGEARTRTLDEQARAQAAQQQYQQAVTGQEQAITTARATPGRYTPETPSWVMYEKYGDAAKDTVVDLSPAKTALAELRAQRGVLPDGTMRPFPKAVEDIAASLERATGIEGVKFETIRQELRKLGPLSRSADGNVRGPAKQLMGIYADVLDASPLANDLLKNANATFRKEMAVQDIADWLKPGHGIVRIDNMGRETINVGALMTRLEKAVADDSLFRRSFAPDELDALRKDVRQLAGTPTMPRGQMPPGAKPEMLPGAAPNVPATMQQAPTPPAALSPKDVPKEIARPRQELLPGAAPGRRGTAEQRALLAPGAEPPPAVTPREALGERPKVFKDLTKTAMQEYMGSLFGVKPLVITSGKLLWRGGEQLRYGMARAILGTQSRPRVMETLREFRGQVGPQLYGTMVNVLSDEERKALLRETRETRERRR